MKFKDRPLQDRRAVFDARYGRNGTMDNRLTKAVCSEIPGGHELIRLWGYTKRISRENPKDKELGNIYRSASEIRLIMQDAIYDKYFKE